MITIGRSGVPGPILEGSIAIAFHGNIHDDEATSEPLIMRENISRRLCSILPELLESQRVISSNSASFVPKRWGSLVSTFNLHKVEGSAVVGYVILFADTRWLIVNDSAEKGKSSKDNLNIFVMFRIC